MRCYRLAIKTSRSDTITFRWVCDSESRKGPTLKTYDFFVMIGILPLICLTGFFHSATVPWWRSENLCGSRMYRSMLEEPLSPVRGFSLMPRPRQSILVPASIASQHGWWREGGVTLNICLYSLGKISFYCLLWSHRYPRSSMAFFCETNSGIWPCIIILVVSPRSALEMGLTRCYFKAPIQYLVGKHQAEFTINIKWTQTTRGWLTQHILYLHSRSLLLPIVSLPRA